MSLGKNASLGKRRRLSRLFKREKVLILAMDHGIPLGNVKEIEDPESILKDVNHNVDAVIMNRGLIKSLESSLSGVEVIYKLNGISSLSPNPFELVQFGDVEEAISYDSVAVSFEMYIGGEQEAKQLKDLRTILRDTERFDIPLILHIYPHGENKDPEAVSHAIRMGWELGPDVIKSFQYRGMRTQLEKIDIPFVAAGGPRFGSPEEVLEYVRNGLAEGVKGFALGRNLWSWRGKVKELSSSIRKQLDSG